MIRPPGASGAAFTERSDGDQRADRSARRAVSNALGISSAWATVDQVHGASCLRVEGPGEAGHADALWTSEPRLPLAVFTADCLGVVLMADGAVGVAHAGWRGAEAGVVVALRREIEAERYSLHSAYVGPGIGPCCFEVGEEVAERFPEGRSSTSWGTESVDLISVISSQLTGLSVWQAGSCTRHEEGWFSHRLDRTPSRLATIAWIP